MDINKNIFLASIDLVKELFENKLPNNLNYHCANHTFGDVIPAIKKLCRMENITERKSLIVLTAGVFHDTGFTIQYKDNEDFGVEIARKELLKFGIDENIILEIENIILATKTFKCVSGAIQCPNNNILEKIMCDADLDNLGRNDFFDLSMKLAVENYKHGIEYEPINWWKKQVDFLKKHSYYTNSAKVLRDEIKKNNIAKCIEIYKNFETGNIHQKFLKYFDLNI